VACTSILSGQCQPLDQARLLATALFNNTQYQYSSNPAILHYSIHAFDTPEKAVYEGGLPFAKVCVARLVEF